MQWITRERPNIDRIACRWLVTGPCIAPACCYRARCGYGAARSGAASARPAGLIARTVKLVRGRSGNAQARLGDVRRVVRMVHELSEGKPWLVSCVIAARR